MGIRREHTILDDGTELKYCSNCDSFLPLPHFAKRKKSWDGFVSTCTSCRHQRERKWRDTNKERYKSYYKKVGKIWRDSHVDRCRDYYTKYYNDVRKELTKEQRLLTVKERSRIQKEYRIQNPEKVHERDREYYKKRKENPFFRLNYSVHSRIYNSFRTGKNGCPWETLVGYSLSTLKNHLESQFEPWMTWDNYGKGEGKWSIDHKRPVSSFTFTSYNDKEFKECWSLNNLRPLADIENSRKGSRLL